MRAKPLNPACPCGLPLRYADCCGRWHAGPQHLQASSAEALMRSRYCAFVRDLGGYLLATWHPRTRPRSLDPSEPGLRWLGLEIKRCETIDTEHGVVEFIARSKLAGRAQRLHETSRFERIDGHWFYVEGDIA